MVAVHRMGDEAVWRKASPPMTFENRLAAGPAMTVPTMTLEGDADGAPHPAPAAYAAKFSGKYLHGT